ncbi:TerC family protein [Aquicoccus sp. G2-2]|uniref:TerC family protein n=1 Tax=Aquicoccus sp. G2-2 TaxID=3092120 RepID=UPI002ADF4B0C|nr:TerC family protein [Aquicoccus sp. G2-2]MEA1112632.1 TerC family protein [Aquicoccus sp. G2-2]
MTHLLSDPSVWASFLTLTVLEIVLGVDNVIFISIAASKLPPERRRAARLLGLSGALVLRIGLLASIAWIASLKEPVFTLFSYDFSWRDVILLSGGLFLIWKASTEIFDEVEGHEAAPTIKTAGFLSVFVQIMLLDVVFSLDSVITAIGIANHLEVMIAAIVVAVLIMMAAAEPISRFVEDHPSTKMLALAFLVMIGMALVADGFHVHLERGFIYAAMVFAGAVEALNLVRARRRRNNAAE